MKKTVHYLVVFLFVSTFFFSCKKDKEPSAMEKAIIEASAKCGAAESYECKTFIKQYVWKGKIVYFNYSGGAYCNSVPVYYDFDGAVLPMESGYTFDEFIAESHFVANYWACQQ